MIFKKRLTELVVPMSERKFHLDRVRELVSHYQPLMEERTGVDLGDVQVRDMKFLSKDVLDRMNGKKICWCLHRGIPHAIMSTWVTWDYLSTMMYIRSLGIKKERKSVACFGHNSLYISFRGQSNITNPSSLDQAIVHELSHGVWDRITEKASTMPRDEENGSDRYTFLGEAFAAYCDGEYFKNLYPKGAQLTDYYPDERRLIGNIIRECGPEILLKLPEKWREFELVKKPDPSVFFEEIGKRSAFAWKGNFLLFDENNL